MATQIHRVTNAVVYLDGKKMLGKTEEITLPEITVKKVEHKALGMIFAIELPAGLDKLEGKIKFNSFYPDVIGKVANPYVAYQLQCRSSVEVYSTQGRISQVPLVTFLTVMFTKLPLGGFKQHENADQEAEYSCIYFKQVLDGQELVEADVMANIFKVNGVDVMLDYRLNTGA
jgi:P2 family phage contractile tail tube protein